MAMKRNATVSIAAGLMLAAAFAQANDVLVASAFASENVIVETSGPAGGSSYENSDWKEHYPFPRHFGPAVD
jgi:hypothetical protein